MSSFEYPPQLRKILEKPGGPTGKQAQKGREIYQGEVFRIYIGLNVDYFNRKCNEIQPDA